MYSKFGQFIDGKWQQAEKKETYDVINPATEEVEIFLAANTIGKFQGTKAATTPTG